MAFLVLQQIEIDNYQGPVHHNLCLPFNPQNVPIMRMYGVTQVTLLIHAWIIDHFRTKTVFFVMFMAFSPTFTFQHQLV